ncbi:hypothetical protein [Qipengyuania sphaerica]|uniref:hypothetical protein n=1 Tax=Qipengyuania sphaerica TaxID=2867243 RepID=UPI001C87F5B5|nr:hypothetical protein [Qipengyuania sphaerica]MBX7539565.1 hypothetical protein [Qipengyuania sphaerica]
MRRHLGSNSGRTISQDQLDRLYTAALEAAIGRIEKDGHFHPLVFELRANGTIQAVAVLETGEVDNTRGPIDRLVALLRPRAEDGTIDAAAIVRLREEGVAEVRMRARNFSANIDVLFSVETSGLVKRKRRIELGDVAAREVPNELF